ncbi:MAG: FAD-binding oxidoreductase [Microbacteriaceae bacterium]|nr:FAD-binding oxidoreductase [Microbacteriaceae bacterium]
MAHDASHYLLVPGEVVTPRDAAGVGRVLAAARAAATPVTFRSGGTSLSGQASTSAVIVDTRRHFRRVVVGDRGETVTVEPGATVRSVNARLARHGRRLGPDPASEIACTIGGVVANNSSGMAAGIAQNAYRTLESLTLVLPSGTVLETGAPDADERLRIAEPELHAGLLRLRERLLAQPAEVATVRRLFAMKNTMGYGVNALLDFDRAVDILAHLVVGSEGTLAFVAEARFATVEVLPAIATGLLVFASLREATAALPALVEAGLATIELMDARSLRVAQAEPDVPAAIAGIEVDRHAAFLIELHARDAADLAEAQTGLDALLAGLPLAAPVRMTTDAGEKAALWHVRKGLYAAVAGARPSGTTALLEDIAVPVDRLLTTCERLLGLFDAHGYEESVVFGHAKDGNIHFMLNERFDEPAMLERYRRFTEDLVDLVLEEGGTLKAEHGTGRIMAPFVRRQYGPELTAIMHEIKRLVDPAGIMNPGVLLSDDAASYLRDLKLAPPVESEVDRCVECGYCEPACPSKDLTLTPRQRIALRREMARAEAAGDAALLAELQEAYEYDGVQTCAVDGMCGTACPVDINTGDLVRRLRAEHPRPLPRAAWNATAGAWAPVTRMGGIALDAAKAMPAGLVIGVTKAARAVVGADVVPLYDRGLPRGGRPRPGPRAPADADAVFFPACIGAMFGAEGDGIGATEAFLRLAERAGLRLVIPEGISGACCGTPWKSKGYASGYHRMSERVLDALWSASDGGRLPIVCDAASCTEGLATMGATADGPYASLTFVDSTRFAQERLLDLLPVTGPVASVMVHHTCSTTALGANAAVTAIARHVAADVTIPDDWGCCAFAGDRGLLHPELTASATAREAAEVAASEAVEHVSANRTCEIGMTRATGKPYRHVLELLEEATR